MRTLGRRQYNHTLSKTISGIGPNRKLLSAVTLSTATGSVSSCYVGIALVAGSITVIESLEHAGVPMLAWRGYATRGGYIRISGLIAAAS